MQVYISIVQALDGQLSKDQADMIFFLLKEEASIRDKAIGENNEAKFGQRERNNKKNSKKRHSRGGNLSLSSSNQQM